MKESYGEGLATHTGPESCGAAREGGVEALTRECAGRVYSRVSQSLRDADAVGESGRPHPVHRYREVQRSPARSQTSCTPTSLFSFGSGLPRAFSCESFTSQGLQHACALQL